MLWIDYVIIGIIALSAIISVVRGFVKEVLSLAAWVLAFWVALTFSPQFSVLLSDYISTPSVSLFAAFAALFIVTLILSALVNHLIAAIVEKTGLSGTDRMLGVLFGILRGVAIVTLLVLLAAATPMPNDDWWQNAVLIEHFEKLAIWARQFLPVGLAQYVNL
ncbi:MAG: CvpA family protein [Piscirickettsiaceae bacterium]|jgi:membrane protein required for colicin V production|nr:CvpA family protein [Piscirickettsiaceae bacterium]